MSTGAAEDGDPPSSLVLAVVVDVVIPEMSPSRSWLPERAGARVVLWGPCRCSACRRGCGGRKDRVVVAKKPWSSTALLHTEEGAMSGVHSFLSRSERVRGFEDTNLVKR